MILHIFISKILSSLLDKIENKDLVERTCEFIENADLEDPIFIIDNSLEFKSGNVLLTFKEEILDVKIFKDKCCTPHIFKGFKFSYETIINVIERNLGKLDLPDNYDLFIDVSPKNKSFMRNHEIEKLESFLMTNLNIENVIVRPVNCPLKIFLHDSHAYVNFYKFKRDEKVFVYLLNTSVCLNDDLKYGNDLHNGNEETKLTIEDDTQYNISSDSQLNGGNHINLTLTDLNKQEHESIISLINGKIDIDSILDLNYKFDHKEFPVLYYSIYNAIMAIPSFFSICAVSTEFRKFMNEGILPIRDQLVSLESKRVKYRDSLDKLDDICKLILIQMRNILKNQFYNAIDKASFRRDLYIFYMRVHEALRFKIQLYIFMINEKLYVNPIEDGILRFYDPVLLERDIGIIKERNINIIPSKFKGNSYSCKMLGFIRQITDLGD